MKTTRVPLPGRGFHCIAVMRKFFPIFDNKLHSPRVVVIDQSQSWVTNTYAHNYFGRQNVLTPVADTAIISIFFLLLIIHQQNTSHTRNFCVVIFISKVFQRWQSNVCLQIRPTIHKPISRYYTTGAKERKQWDSKALGGIYGKSISEQKGPSNLKRWDSSIWGRSFH